MARSGAAAEPGVRAGRLCRRSGRRRVSCSHECGRIFRVGKRAEVGSTGEPLRLHRHQAEAVRAARDGQNYVLTTGTGSGKSSRVHRPDRRPRAADASRRGTERIKAIVVYPMNALANSQEEELRKFLSHGYPDGTGPVDVPTVHGPGERRAARGDPFQPAGHPADELRDARVHPHAPVRRRVGQGGTGALVPRARRAAHVPRPAGRDVALLVRRVRDACKATNLRCVARRRRWPARDVRRAAGRGRAGREPLVRRDGRAGERHRRDASPRDRRRRPRRSRLPRVACRARPLPASRRRPTRRRSPIRSRPGSSARSGSPGTRPTSATRRCVPRAAARRGRRWQRCSPRRRGCRGALPRGATGGAAHAAAAIRSPRRLPGLRVSPAPVLQRR